jgi:drug/metabolite transporter (DMT)-like permease
MLQSIDDWNRQGNCFRAPITKQERERFRLGLLILTAGLIAILVAIGLFLQSEYSSSYLAGAILTALISLAPILSGLYRMFRHSWWIEYNP